MSMLSATQVETTINAEAPRVYAPASARIRKDALPWDAEILESGARHEITSEAALHPGDRSESSEIR
jgi:hypothetical protein